MRPLIALAFLLALATPALGAGPLAPTDQAVCPTGFDKIARDYAVFKRGDTYWLPMETVAGLYCPYTVTGIMEEAYQPNRYAALKGDQFVIYSNAFPEAPAPAPWREVWRCSMDVPEDGPGLANGWQKILARSGEGTAYGPAGGNGVKIREADDSPCPDHVRDPAYGDQGRDVALPTPQVEGLPVDQCLTWKTDCGQPAADAYCRYEGYAKASSFARARRAPTRSIGDQRLCTGFGCKALSDVVCTGRGNIPAAPKLAE